MTVPTIISANVSPTHKGADSRGCIVGPSPIHIQARTVGKGKDDYKIVAGRVDFFLGNAASPD
jgi:hypothetical protein